MYLLTVHLIVTFRVPKLGTRIHHLKSGLENIFKIKFLGTEMKTVILLEPSKSIMEYRETTKIFSCNINNTK